MTANKSILKGKRILAVDDETDVLDTIEDVAEQDVESTSTVGDEEIDRLINAEADAEQAREMGKLADLRAELDTLKARGEKQK